MRTPPRSAALVLLAICMAGCGGAYEPREASTAEPERDVAGYETRIDELEMQLHAMGVLSGFETETLDEGGEGADDCKVAADLRDRICDLAQRICDIAERDPSASDVALKCERSAQTCARAKQSCGCGSSFGA